MEEGPRLLFSMNGLEFAYVTSDISLATPSCKGVWEYGLQLAAMCPAKTVSWKERMDSWGTAAILCYNVSRVLLR